MSRRISSASWTRMQATELTAPVDQKQMEALGHLIYVKEYADNTIRGSAAVKHWRIGGE